MGGFQRQSGTGTPRAIFQPPQAERGGPVEEREKLRKLDRDDNRKTHLCQGGVRGRRRRRSRHSDAEGRIPQSPSCLSTLTSFRVRGRGDSDLGLRDFLSAGSELRAESSGVHGTGTRPIGGDLCGPSWVFLRPMARALPLGNHVASFRVDASDSIINRSRPGNYLCLCLCAPGFRCCSQRGKF